MLSEKETATEQSVQIASAQEKRQNSNKRQSQKLVRWIGHCRELYGYEGTVGHAYVDNLFDSPTKHNLDQLSDADEVINIIKKIRFGKATGQSRDFCCQAVTKKTHEPRQPLQLAFIALAKSL